MNITERLKIVMEYYELSPSNLADKLDVQRSSISHLLSGRNNPSLDFVLKILDTFPEVDLYWFVKGIGEFPLIENKSNKKSNTQFSSVQNIDQQEFDFPSDTNLTQPINQDSNSIINFNHHEIEQIVIFYKDGSFKTYSPKK